MLDDFSLGFVKLKKDEIIETVKARVEGGEDPIAILEDARCGMTAVGDHYQEGKLYLAEMLLAAEIFKQAVAILNPYLARSRPPEPRGKVVIATLKGDIHDLGKNILKTLLESQGFEVHDLGVDVDPLILVDTVKEVEPHFVGFSALITAAFDNMRKAKEMLEKEGLRDKFKFMVGGGVTNSMLKDYLGADFQTTDAMEGVAYCLKIMEENSDA